MPNGQVGQGACRLLGASPGERKEQVSQTVAETLVHLPHHAEVDQTDGSTVFDQQVSRMGISMEEPVFEDHLGNGPGSAHGKGASINPRGVQSAQVINFDAADSLQGEHARRGRRPHNSGYVDGGVRSEILGEPVSVAAFTKVIQLGSQRTSELIDDTFHVVSSGRLPVPARIDTRPAAGSGRAR
ncbi:MAG TPA: hypothetical protein VIT65_22640 [Microlunatus sp.]